MTAAAPTASAAGRVDVSRISRIAPSGAGVDLALPAVLGTYGWYGTTRFSGPRLARQFFLAPAGEHRAIATRLLPGARVTRQAMRGHDAVVVEAADRSDSALVLVGPHHEATTWFGGPAPDAAGVGNLLSTFRFTDSARGASLVTASPMVRQSDVALIGRAPGSVLVVRPAVDLLPTLPGWAGLALPGGELWRAGRVLNIDQSRLVAGTAHQWRYLLAGATAAMDLVLLGPESGRPAFALGEAQIVDALTALTSSWGN